MQGQRRRQYGRRLKTQLRVSIIPRQLRLEIFLLTKPKTLVTFASIPIAISSPVIAEAKRIQNSNFLLRSIMLQLSLITYLLAYHGS